MQAFDYDQAFSRNLGWVRDAEQSRLRQARVAIAGLGGLGLVLPVLVFALLGWSLASWGLGRHHQAVVESNCWDQ